ncbi:hypothetical protein N9N67_09825 [Bacteriovoracaceae bacterium]|nr:hypothetical protein [Bacteriovoracaceae bacterium]
MRFYQLLALVTFSLIFTNSFATDSATINMSLIKKFNQLDKTETNLGKLIQYNNTMLPEHLIPWEGSYWPHRTGSIAFRKKALARIDWGINFLFGAKNYVRKITSKIEANKQKFDKLSSKDIKKMSAVEKYDVLIGDRNFSTTRNILRSITNNHHYWGRTTNWTGICHGWTPASIHFGRPLKSVMAKGSSGQDIEFTIEDLKALSSYLFSNSVISENTVFIGNRCNVDKPGLDPETKLVREVEKFTRNPGECSDINPAYFFLTLYNRIGIKQKSFIVDIDYNSPVNNHPVAGFKTEMVNLVTNEKVNNLRHALVPIAMLENDRFAKIRNEQAHFVVQFKTKVYYVDWIRPGVSKESREKDKRFTSRTYSYQLELDKKLKIVGGQWTYDKKNIQSPDFIWVYPDAAYPHEFNTNLSQGIDYTHNEPINPRLTKAAIYSSNAKLRTNYYTRVRHPKSKELGIHERAEKYAKENEIHLRDTQDKFIEELNKNNVPFWIANPQLISKIINSLMDESTQQ